MAPIFIKSKIFNLKTVLTFAFLLRILILLFLVNDGNFIASDSRLYKESALTLLENNSFSLSRQNLDIPLLIRTPGYSFFIAILYKIFNVHDIVLIIANIAISLISLVLINKTLSLFTTSNTALIGSLMYAVEPLSLSLIFYVLPQILFQSLLITIAFFSIKLLKKDWTYKIWFLFGLSLSVASIIKPVGFSMFSSFDL